MLGSESDLHSESKENGKYDLKKKDTCTVLNPSKGRMSHCLEVKVHSLSVLLASGVSFSVGEASQWPRS